MIQIVYGSGGGNTELVCNMIAEKLLKDRSPVRLTRAKVSSFDDLESEADLYILASPTYGHGQLEKYMGKFIAGYKSSDFDMKGKKFAVVGLGDKKYDEDYYIESARILEKFVTENGGELVCESLKIGGCVYNSLEEKVSSFCKSI
jgi:flavodoxin